MICKEGETCQCQHVHSSLDHRSVVGSLRELWLALLLKHWPPKISTIVLKVALNTNQSINQPIVSVCIVHVSQN